MPFIAIKIPLEVKPEVAEVSQSQIDLFLVKVQEGHTFSAAAKSLSIPSGQLRGLLSKIGDAELTEAMRIGAETLVDKASTELEYADGKEEIDRAKALAQHYRWLAAKLNKSKYGDAIKVDGNANNGPTYQFNMILDPAMAAQARERLVKENDRLLQQK